MLHLPHCCNGSYVTGEPGHEPLEPCCIAQLPVHMILPKNWTGPYVKEAEGKEQRGRETYGHRDTRDATSDKDAAPAA